MISRLSGSHLRPTTIAIAVGALVVNLISCFALHHGSKARLDVDPQEYFSLSTQVLHGHYAFNPRRTIFYPAILAFFRILSADHLLGTQLIAAAFFSTTTPLAYLLMVKITGQKRAAIVFALAVLFWPLFIVFDGSLYSETVALPFFLAFLLVLPRGSRFHLHASDAPLQSALAGLLLATCILLRPMYLFYIPFVIIILLIEESLTAVAINRIIQTLVACAVVILPWSIYSSLEAGELILVSSNGGETLSGGLTPAWFARNTSIDTTESGHRFWMGPGKWLPIHSSGYLSRAEQQLPYLDQDKLLRARTLAWVKENPGLALYLEGAKLLYMWGFYPFDLREKLTYLSNIPTILVLSLAVGSMIRFRSAWRTLGRFWTLPLFVSLVALASWGSWRFREPGDLGTLGLAALLVVAWVFHDSQATFGEKSVRNSECIKPDSTPAAFAKVVALS